MATGKACRLGAELCCYLALLGARNSTTTYVLYPLEGSQSTCLVDVCSLGALGALN